MATIGKEQPSKLDSSSPAGMCYMQGIAICQRNNVVRYWPEVFRRQGTWQLYFALTIYKNGKLFTGYDRKRLTKTFHKGLLDHTKQDSLFWNAWYLLSISNIFIDFLPQYSCLLHRAEPEIWGHRTKITDDSGELFIGSMAWWMVKCSTRSEKTSWS